MVASATNANIVDTPRFSSNLCESIHVENSGMTDTLFLPDQQVTYENAGQPTVDVSTLASFLRFGYWGGSEHHWSSSTITYNLGNLNASERTLALAALDTWHNVANLTFVQSATANINFNHDGSLTAVTSSSWSGTSMTSAIVDISSDWVARYGTGIDTYSYQTYIHEIGHALGLGHQGPYNSSATYGTDNIYANDTWQFSVMSYFAQNNYGGSSYRFTMTPMMADIYAVASIYGAANTRAGDTVYGFNSSAGSIFNFASYAQAPAFTITDAGGNDTLDASGYSANQTIDLRAGNFSSIGGLVNNVAIAISCTIEIAKGGSGGDIIIANDFGCTLYGNGGNDSLFGGAGNDLLIGGSGNDALNGGGGVNGARFSGSRGLYAISDLGGGSIRVVGADGTDTLSNVRNLFFDDATIAWPVAPVISSFGDFNSNASRDYIWRDSGAYMTMWEYDASAQSISTTNLGVVGLTWSILSSGHFSAASTDQMLVKSGPDSEMALWWVNGGSRTGVNIGPYWNNVNYVASGQFTNNGGAGIANFLVSNPGDGHLYDWWINGSNQLQGIDLGAVGKDKAVIGTGQFSGQGGTNFLVTNTTDRHLYDWWVNGSNQLQGYDLGAVGSDVSFIAAGKFNANAAGNDSFLVVNTADKHLYNWWINPVSHALTGADLGAAWSGVQFLAAGRFDNSTTNDQILVKNTSDNHLYVWWVDGANVLSGLDLGAATGIDFIESRHFNNANGSGSNAEWLMRNTADGHLYEWWVSGGRLSGADLGTAPGQIMIPSDGMSTPPVAPLENAVSANVGLVSAGGAPTLSAATWLATPSLDLLIQSAAMFGISSGADTFASTPFSSQGTPDSLILPDPRNSGLHFG